MIPHWYILLAPKEQEKVRTGDQATTVEGMTRCRADSFYLAPGYYREFADWDVYTKVKGVWVRITHRKDVERLDLDPTWDKICYVSWGKSYRDTEGNPTPMDKRISDDPRDIELWKLDKRLVNGKRSGVEHHLSTIASKGAARSGGIQEAVGAVLGKENVGKLVAHWLKTTKVEPTRQAMALKLLSMAQDVLDPASLESLAAKMTSYCAPVPVANFTTSTAHTLEFMKRYPMQRRVTLLLDLWKEQELVATDTCVRVALELLERGGPIRQKALEFMKNLGENHSETVAKLATKNQWGVEGSSILYSTKVRAILDGKPSTRAICAFHPDNTDPTQALRILRDRKYLETKGIALFNEERLSPQVAKALQEELEKTSSIKQTHSPNKCYNLLKLVVAICEVEPAANHLLVQAYAAWSKTYEASDRWANTDVDMAFRGSKLQLDALTVEKIYKIQTELMRKSLGTTETSQNMKIGDEKLPGAGATGWVGCVSSELVARLESQKEVPSQIREQCRMYLDRQSLFYRNEEGVLVSWTDFVKQSTNITKDLPLVLDRYAKEHTEDTYISHYSATFVYAAHLPMSDEEYGQLRELCQTGSRECAQKYNTVAREDICKNMDEVRAGATGKLIIAPGTTFDYRDWAHRALELHAQTTTQEQRKWLIEQSGDADVAYVGWLMTGECDTVQIAGRRDETSSKIQTSSLVSGVDGIVWPEKPKKWEDLPTADYIPWVLPAVHRNLDGRTIVLGGENYDVRVIKNIESLVANAAPNCMGNCTDSYASDIRKGTSLILAIGRGGRTEINVNVYLHNSRSGTSAHGEPVWLVGEIKGPSNKSLDSKQEEAVSKQVAALLN